MTKNLNHLVPYPSVSTCNDIPLRLTVSEQFGAILETPLISIAGMQEFRPFFREDD